MSTGIPGLDEMLGREGYRGSSILSPARRVRARPAAAAHFADAACRRGERCLYFAFEESPAQILRNVASIGIRLGPYVQKGLLQFEAVRPNYHGLEGHLLSLHGAVDRFRPAAVIVDPVTGLANLGSANDIGAMLTRIIGHLKNLNVTSVFTSLTAPGEFPERSEVGVSSLMDSWILVHMVESAGERRRRLCVLKSRGMAHSNQVRELVMSRRGLRLVDAAEGPAVPSGGRGPGKGHERSVAIRPGPGT